MKYFLSIRIVILAESADEQLQLTGRHGRVAKVERYRDSQSAVSSNHDIYDYLFIHSFSVHFMLLTFGQHGQRQRSRESIAHTRTFFTRPTTCGIYLISFHCLLC